MHATLAIRARGEPLTVLEPLRAHLREMDPNLPLADVKTMSEWAAEASFTPRFGALFLGAFAAVALLLSTVGVYGVLSVVVAGQNREVGVRMALGARREDILKTVLSRAARMVVPGVVVGVSIALVFTRLLEAMLFEG